MNLTNDQLKRVIKLVLEARIKYVNRLDEDLLQKLSVEFVERTIEKDFVPKKETKKPKQNDDFCPAYSTASTAKKLKVTESDLRALRNANELKKDFHYITGKNPKPTAIWYDLDRTCFQLHGIAWRQFSKPNFDLKAHTERRTAQVFDAMRKRNEK